MDKKEFKKSFIKHFAKDLTSKQLKVYNVELGMKGALWNVFAAGLVSCFVGDEAREEYNKANKNNAEIFNLDNLKLTRLPNNCFTSKEVDNYGFLECYIIGENFSWVYVITHEGDLCGPYFAYSN